MKAIIMALDPLEKDLLRRKMADRMNSFTEAGSTVSCVSGHYSDEPRPCELCLEAHAQELVVIKNRANKKLQVAVSCLKEMMRFRVVDVDDFPKWLEKLKVLRAEEERRKAEREAARQEERRRLEKKVIVRKRTVEPGT